LPIAATGGHYHARRADSRVSPETRAQQGRDFARGAARFAQAYDGRRGLVLRRVGKVGERLGEALGARVDEKAVGLAAFVFIRIYAVVTAFVRRKLLQKIRGDAGALQEYVIGPGGVAIHAAEQNALMLVSAGAEISIEDVGVRPEGEREAENLEDVAAHAFAGLLGVFGKGRKLVEGVYFFCGVGGDEA